MSAAELVIVIVGLLIGYWVVGRLLPKKFSNRERETQGQQQEKQQQPRPPPREREWFEVLGLRRSASIEAIRDAYRALISQYHPDKVATLGLELRNLAEQKSKEINLAYRNGMRARGADS